MAETASSKTSLPTIPHQTVSLQTARESSASVYPAKERQLARWALSGKPDACPFVPSSIEFKDERVDPRADAMDGFFVEWLRELNPYFFDLYGASIAACWPTKMKAQGRCVLLYLSMAGFMGWIVPEPFGDVKSKGLFFGWRGFKVVEAFGDVFKRGLFWVFSLKGGRECDDSTIQQFFRKTANMKPAATQWNPAYLGKVPFVLVKPPGDGDGVVVRQGPGVGQPQSIGELPMAAVASHPPAAGAFTDGGMPAAALGRNGVISNILRTTSADEADDPLVEEAVDLIVRVEYCRRPAEVGPRPAPTGPGSAGRAETGARSIAAGPPLPVSRQGVEEGWVGSCPPIDCRAAGFFASCSAALGAGAGGGAVYGEWAPHPLESAWGGGGFGGVVYMTDECEEVAYTPMELLDGGGGVPPLEAPGDFEDGLWVWAWRVGGRSVERLDWR